jgi:hypothetical protein
MKQDKNDEQDDKRLAREVMRKQLERAKAGHIPPAQLETIGRMAALFHGPDGKESDGRPGSTLAAHLRGLSHEALAAHTLRFTAGMVRDLADWKPQADRPRIKAAAIAYLAEWIEKPFEAHLLEAEAERPTKTVANHAITPFDAAAAAPQQE